jgi:hypothetical protein
VKTAAQDIITGILERFKLPGFDLEASFNHASWTSTL